MVVEAHPGARFEEMWRQFMGLLQDGKVGPKGPGFLQIMTMAHEFSDVMAIAGPPLFLQRAVATVITPIGRLRGYRGRYEEYLTCGPSEIVDPEPLPEVCLRRHHRHLTEFPKGSNNDECGTSSPNRVDRIGWWVLVVIAGTSIANARLGILFRLRVGRRSDLGVPRFGR